MSSPERLSLAALNRALLARQGLLDRLDAPLVEAVEAIGALQAQHWPAPPAALASRVEGFSLDTLLAALQAGELVTGTLLRTTLHLVSAREHPAYAAVAREVADWTRSKAQPGPAAQELLDALVAHARRTTRTVEELGAFAEQWVAAHPDALHPDELEAQRHRNWRAVTRWAGFVRVPADGAWGARAPSSLRAARGKAPAHPLDAVIRRHLRAFGPASAEDVASWLGWRAAPVREALARLAPRLARFEDEDGRTLHDLPDGPRPDPGAEAPPRLLAPFDSVLLAYVPKHRARILPVEHKDAVYDKRNLRVLPSYLVDGRVAGTWSVEVRRGVATLTLAPLQRLPRGTRGPLVDEAERVLALVQPETNRRVVVAR